LADRPEIQLLLRAQQAPLASALLVSGTALRNTVALDTLLKGTPVDVDALATKIAKAGDMPPILMALLGVTPGGPVPPQFAGTPTPGLPAARDEFALLMPDEAAAKIAADVATKRLATGVSAVNGQPYAAMFDAWHASVPPGTPVMRLELDFAPRTSPSVWIEMPAARDLLFLAW
jgi:hypothetical protein